MEPQDSFWSRPGDGEPAPDQGQPATPDVGASGPWGQTWHHPAANSAPPAGPPSASFPPNQLSQNQFPQPPQQPTSHQNPYQPSQQTPYQQNPQGPYQQAPYQQGPQNPYARSGFPQPGFQPPGAPRPPWQPAPTPQPTPRRSALVIAIVLGLVMLAATGTGVGVVIGRTLAPTNPSTPPVSIVGPTASAPVSVTPTPSESSSTPSASPSASTGLEIYGDFPELIDNKMYALQAKPVECTGLSLPVPEGKKLDAWGKKSITCIYEHYLPIVEQAGYTLTVPSITFFDDEITTPCGEGGTGAFYCSENEGIYVERGRYTSEGGRLNTIRMLVHEFSHHVQQRTGILTDDKYGLEPIPQVSRRIELQASCWSEMQLRDSKWLKWTDDDEEWLEAFNSVDSDKLHGNAKSRHYWYDQGRSGSSLSVCNTWIAPDSRVG